ncbi:MULTISPECIES: hypothetical protein [Cytobacillus]|uniref:Ankyrin repeat domain-containing protein n=2 Tax=Bacillati TaxID=1783272 RepID=A0A2N0ZN18_9BACI|nr:hypothetical protein [Cytobacillus horneckiae]MEC1157718.1 hypothetical protein [Cytobacillus horneckiae]PKG30910.1 hypothetical protein CWS20_01035 [Cytobacillus horneckiae]
MNNKKRYPVLHTEEEIIQRLCFLIINKNTAEFEYRLNQGIDPNIKVEGTPILMIASQFSLIDIEDKRAFEIVQLLLRYGANPLETDLTGKNAIDLLLTESEKEEKQLQSLFPSFIPYQKREILSHVI